MPDGYCVKTLGGRMFVVLFRMALLPCEFTTPPVRVLTLCALWLTCVAKSQICELLLALAPKPFALRYECATFASVVEAWVRTAAPPFWLMYECWISALQFACRLMPWLLFCTISVSTTDRFAATLELQRMPVVLKLEMFVRTTSTLAAAKMLTPFVPRVVPAPLMSRARSTTLMPEALTTTP